MQREFYSFELLESRRLLSAASLVNGVLTVSGTGGSDNVAITENIILVDPANPNQTQNVLGVEIAGDQTYFESSPGAITAIRVYDPTNSDTISKAANVSVTVERTSTPPVSGSTQGVSSTPTPNNPANHFWDIYVGVPNGSLAPKK